MNRNDATASHDHRTWFSSQSVKLNPQCGISRTTEKSIVLRVCTHEEKLASRGDQRPSDDRATHARRLTRGEEHADDRSDRDVSETLAALYTESARKKQWLDSEEKTFWRGQQRLSSLQREYAALLRTLEQRKRRRKERLCTTTMLRGRRRVEGTSDCECNCESSSGSSGSSSDSDDSSLKDERLLRSNRCSSNSSSQKRRPGREGAKKERKRLRRFRREVSLRFQLLESECRESKLQMEKVVGDLRREYADSCLFGTSLKF
ncbi:unnamed protein product [Hyaloperonospora brassicae]|uniref:BZIP domain-containing protein n=1 Tax=Hyaloperonospora brassicae TaxID=162125 RepID=A0AAV0SZW2_HYABA|nr:unnamed protein product [Hyaloperonospora brassicae]